MELSKRFFYINSGAQLTQHNNSFTYEVQIPDNEPFNRITLMQANIPVSYYTIESPLNTFVLNEGGTLVTITFTEGNYNANSFSSILTTMLNAASPNLYTYSVSYPNSFTSVQTGKFTFTVNTIAKVIKFIFPQDSPITSQFGFDEASTQIFTAGVSSSTLTSGNVIDFVPKNTLFIHSSLVQDDNSDVLQEIYANNSAPFQLLTWENPNPFQYSKKLASGKSTLARFAITDEFGRPIFFHGLDVVLTIMIYQSQDYYNLAKQHLKFQLQKEIELHDQQQQQLQLAPTLPEQGNVSSNVGDDEIMG